MIVSGNSDSESDDEDDHHNQITKQETDVNIYYLLTFYYIKII